MIPTEIYLMINKKAVVLQIKMRSLKVLYSRVDLALQVSTVGKGSVGKMKLRRKYDQSHVKCHTTSKETE